MQNYMTGKRNPLHNLNVESYNPCQCGFKKELLKRIFDQDLKRKQSYSYKLTINEDYIQKCTNFVN